MDLDALWNSFLSIIKDNIASLSYETWFKDTKLVSLKNKIATVVVPMPVHKKHIVENYMDIVEDKFNQVAGNTYSFEFLLQEEWNNIVEDNGVVEEVKDVDEGNKKKNTKRVKDFDKANLNKEYILNKFKFILDNCLSNKMFQPCIRLISNLLIICYKMEKI